MSQKFTDLPVAGALTGSEITAIVQNVSGTLTSEQASLATIKTFVLSGTAATATKLATPVTINGISFDGSGNITITAPVGAATNTVLGGVIVPSPATSGLTLVLSGGTAGTIGLAVASGTQLGGVKVGSGIAVAGDGTISVTSTPVATSSTSGSVIVPAAGGLKVDGSGNISDNIVVHAFSFDANKNLIYSKIDDTNITMTTDGVNSTYVTYDVGTSQYSYSLDSNGNLIATFAS